MDFIVGGKAGDEVRVFRFVFTGVTLRTLSFTDIGVVQEDLPGFGIPLHAEVNEVARDIVVTIAVYFGIGQSVVGIGRPVLIEAVLRTEFNAAANEITVSIVVGHRLSLRLHARDEIFRFGMEERYIPSQVLIIVFVTDFPSIGRFRV
ncbi:hypothetical protein HMPREF3224_02136 [Anaerococcus hydrogenalis]|nr:hypothetical protein HMPREF3224_02136 [Anaerococcus hydrogenalis]